LVTKYPNWLNLLNYEENFKLLFLSKCFFIAIISIAEIMIQPLYFNFLTYHFINFDCFNLNKRLPQLSLPFGQEEQAPPGQSNMITIGNNVNFILFSKGGVE